MCVTIWWIATIFWIEVGVCVGVCVDVVQAFRE